VAGDPSTSRSGARTFAGSPATWRLFKPSWVGGCPRKRNRQLYGIVGSSVTRATPLLRKREMAPATLGAWARQRRGARGRPATRCTATHEDATGSNIPGNGLADPARGRPAEHATRRSNVAARYVPLTAVTHYRRCSPAHRACRGGPTPPAGGSGPKPGPPRHLPGRTRVFRSHAARSHSLTRT
jgi:hypothetical protein